jgi:hypothetical protein
VIAAIQDLMVHETVGDPITGLKWTRKTLKKISRELSAIGIRVSRSTVARLLRQLGYSLRVNQKKIASGCSQYRDQQFGYIKRLRRAFERDGMPVISVDTKKKELVGNFKNPGAAWARSPTLVKDHDFRSEAVGMAVPYGVLDLPANRGHVFVGISHDTPAFAVDALVQWWVREGSRRYPRANRLLILADTGGSNGSRVRSWKFLLQTQLCNRFRISVTVCHYPPGTSKWNPIEHRLFSEISKNWAGRPLESYQTVLNCIRTTKTETGLRVRATLIRRDYPVGSRVTLHDMDNLNLLRHNVLPEWNYTIRPAC